MLLKIEHRTHYVYSEPVSYTIQQLRLTPPEGYGQHVRNWEIRVNGNLYRAVDTFGNIAHTLVVDALHEELTIVASGEVETGVETHSVYEPMPLQIYLRSTPLTTLDDNLRKFAEQFKNPTGVTGLKEIESLMKAIVEKVPYEKGSTTVDTSAAEAFALGKGVCQDHVHVFVSCCRALGVPARYVSGYLFTKDGSQLVSHPWADIWLPAKGWHSLDVCNGKDTGEGHVRLASGLDYRDACPISGSRVGGGEEKMTVNVKVNQMQQQQAQ